MILVEPLKHVLTVGIGRGFLARYAMLLSRLGTIPFNTREAASKQYPLDHLVSPRQLIINANNPQAILDVAEALL